jgi:hypothetical protein
MLPGSCPLDRGLPEDQGGRGMRTRQQWADDAQVLGQIADALERHGTTDEPLPQDLARAAAMAALTVQAHIELDLLTPEAQPGQYQDVRSTPDGG